MLPHDVRNGFLVCLTVVLTAAPIASVNAQTNGGDIGFAGVDACNPGIIDIPLALKQGPRGEQSELLTNMEADEIATAGEDLIKLTGNARVVQGKRGVYADEITYDKTSNQVAAAGNVILYTAGGDEVRADVLDMEAHTFIGTAEQARMKIADKSPYKTARRHHGFVETYSILSPFRNRSIQIPDTRPVAAKQTYVRTRATARSVDFAGADYELLHDATVTSCEEGNSDVLLDAKQIELDHATGIGTAKSMKIKFKNVPIFYFPTVSFPINDERKTGFLFPTIGFEGISGTIIETPYYINIAGNHDATIIPRILSRRGVQIFGEYRYLTPHSRGEMKGEFLPSDNIFEDDRHAFSLDHRHYFNNRWDADIDLQTVSDTEYLRDFSSDVDVLSARYVPQRGNLNFRGDNINFGAKISAFEIVNPDASLRDRPYEKTPELSLDLKDQYLGRFTFGAESGFVDFSHDASERVSGTRLRVKPYLSLPLRRIYGYVKPTIAVHTIRYALENPEYPDSSPSVSVPSVTVDNGLFFERNIRLGEKAFLQTLEPRLFYVNIPDKPEQEMFPDFDTGAGSGSSFSYFFRENRFFGGDRVGDTEQLSVGLTSRIIDEQSGKQRLKLSFGQVFYFKDRKVGLEPDSPAETENKSDFLAEITTSLNDDWNVRGFARRGSTSHELEFVQLSADYYHSNRRNASIAYTETRNSSKQINIKFETPIASRWQLEAGADYSMKDNQARSSLVGVTYDGCCWAISIGSQRYLDGHGVYKNRFLATFQLDGLGRIRGRKH